MKKLRVFQTVKLKRTVPGFSHGNRGTVLLFHRRPVRKGYWPLFLLLAPYLVTFLFGNIKEGAAEYGDRERKAGEGYTFVCNTTGLGSERIPLEDYVADRLARSIDESWELETLKAQAVLIRSGLLASLERGGGSTREILVEDGGYGSGQVSEKIWAAVTQSAGVCLFYEGHPVSGAYFGVSNGATRNAGELRLTGYPYLKSVLCSRDFLAGDYTSMAVYTQGEFERLWQQAPAFQITEEEIRKDGSVAVENELESFSLYRDSVGYVLFVEREGKFVSGEQFGASFHLASSSFHLDSEDGRIVARVKGTGHGLGMSQFGANEMAKEGSDYVEILNYFFQDVIITKFE